MQIDKTCRFLQLLQEDAKKDKVPKNRYTVWSLCGPRELIWLF